MTHELICDRCSASMTPDGLKQAQTEEGFRLRPVNDYNVEPKFEAWHRDWDGVDGNRCWMCIQVQHWIWPRLTSGPRTPWGEAEDNGGGFPGPWAEPGAWVSVWSNSLAPLPDSEVQPTREGALPVSLPLPDIKPFSFLSVKDPRTRGRIHPVKPERGFLCWGGDVDGDPVASHFAQRFPEVEFGWISPLIRRTRIMLNSCLSTHPECRQRSKPLLPKRVIDVGSSASLSRTASLHVSGASQRAEYACLSYCWGKDQQQTLTTANESALRKVIDPTQLGRTIQDAITKTQLLGIRYLWVDALCILQDDAQDKAVEIRKMASIYGNSTVTLYIGQARSVSEGFLVPHLAKPPEKGHQGMRPMQHNIPLPSPHSTIKVNLLPLDNRLIDSFSYSGPFEREVDVYLDYRAWAFQEFLLSPRVLLIMSGNIYWICKRWHYQPMYFQHRFHRNVGNINSLPHLHEILSQGKDMSASKFAKAWNYIFDDYVTRQLTDHEDRLDALTGVISVIEEARGDKCHFGHWESTLPASLAWVVWDDQPLTQGQPRGCTRVPSWSWASWKRRDFPFGEHITPRSEVLSVESDGTLRLRARMLPCGSGRPFVDDGELRESHHSWLRVIIGNTEPKAEKGTSVQSVTFTCLLLERMSYLEDGTEVFCRRGVAYRTFELPETTTESLLEAQGVERIFCIK